MTVRVRCDFKGWRCDGMRYEFVLSGWFVGVDSVVVVNSYRVSRAFNARKHVVLSSA